jgi:hypothetical protein
MLIKVFCCLLCWPTCFVLRLVTLVLILKCTRICTGISIPPCYLNCSCSILMFVRGVVLFYPAMFRSFFSHVFRDQILVCNWLFRYESVYLYALLVILLLVYRFHAYCFEGFLVHYLCLWCCVRFRCLPSHNCASQYVACWWNADGGGRLMVWNGGGWEGMRPWV